MSPSQASESRVALVIGNGKYQDTGHWPELDNPLNDAKDIATALRGFHFEVIELKNQTKEGMDKAIAEFGRKIGNSEAALFYFAGHGMQVKSQNYLIPVDAKFESEAQVAYQSINVNQILDEIDNGQSQANIVILDACRNNPLSGKFRSGAVPGLAVPSSQPKSTVIVYATDPGNVSSDGKDRNGLFTAGLLTAFKGSDLSLHGVLSLASAEVERGSIEAGNNKQTPYVNGPMTLQDSFQFAPGSISKPPVRTEMVSPALDPAAIELSFWNSIKDSNDPADFEAYLKQYPAGRFADLAHNRIRQLKAATVRPEPAPPPVVEPPVAVRPEPTPVCASCLEEMVQIPGGSFMMGSSSAEQNALDINEKPRHEVQVAAFSLGKYEVTQGQWRKVMGNNPSFDQKCGDDCPVGKVSYNDVQDFIDKLNRQTGQRYRLPTEAEWEYACRGGGTEDYCGSNNVDAVAWYGSNSGQKSHAVGGKQPNGFGLYDMSGNVWEWTCSTSGYDGSENTCANNTNPYRIFHGGSWADTPAHVRSAFRNWISTSFRGSNGLGFRLAQDIEDLKESMKESLW
jgi:formylglycine-generating enzyme required for sulfatase activity